MSHASFILQNAPSLCQTAIQSTSQSVRQADGRLIPTNLDGTRDRQLAKVECARKTKAPPKALGDSAGNLFVIFFVFLH